MNSEESKDWILGIGWMNTGHWILGNGYWRLEIGVWTGVQRRDGEWTLDTGSWTLDTGEWSMESVRIDNGSIE